MNNMKHCLVPVMDFLKWAAFGNHQFVQRQEFEEFRFKFLIVLMLASGGLTALFILGQLSEVNPIGWPHMGSMVFFTSAAFGVWLWLRSRPNHFRLAAWTYLAVSLWECTSSLMFVPADELRILWFYTNIPGVFILLGTKAGWGVTIMTVLGLVLGNAHLSQPYSPNAMATGTLGILYMAVMFHAFSNRSLSYFKRMREFNGQLQTMASHDPLTGVMNARAYFESCEQQIGLAQRTGQDFGVLFIDLDHFKSINDRYGHAAGDEVLRVVSATIEQAIRSSDRLGRIGGEEFSVFLPNTDEAGVLRVAETIRSRIEACRPLVENTPLSITASIGVAMKRFGNQTMQAIQSQADEAMYVAKREGRNRVSYLGGSVTPAQAPN
jgi:diguanylate cyclase (GGDEF)-like protein